MLVAGVLEVDGVGVGELALANLIVAAERTVCVAFETPSRQVSPALQWPEPMVPVRTVNVPERAPLPFVVAVPRWVRSHAPLPLPFAHSTTNRPVRFAGQFEPLNVTVWPLLSPVDGDAEAVGAGAALAGEDMTATRANVATAMATPVAAMGARSRAIVFELIRDLLSMLGTR
ncbi:MAG: hypothetical protein JWQ77_4098 [Jatrophihabitans sp.]|nr:hypothetical protein [Jatrophihabitans sp.]